MPPARETPEKTCPTCGRRFAWRRKWARVWESVRYCSERCRRGRAGGLGAQLERAVLDVLEGRARGASVCPSEVARAVRPDDWRPLLPQVRRAAARLAARGLVEVTQRGRPVEVSSAKGPVRIRRRARASDETAP